MKHAPSRIAAAAVAVISMTSLAACGGTSDSSEGKAGDGSVSVMFPFPDSIIWTGYEVARSSIYPELGLEPTTVAGSGNSSTIQQLAAGKIPFAVSGAAELITAASQGRDLVGIANLNADLFSIRAMAGSGVASVEDLKGKNLGVPSMSDGVIPLVKAALANAGLEENDDVKLVVVGDAGPAVAQALKSHKIDALAGAVPDVAAMAASGVELTPILSDEFSNIPSNELVVTRKTLDDPEALQQAIDFAAGWFAGVLAAEKDPTGSLEGICELVPSNCEDEETARSLFDAAVEIQTGPAEAAGRHDLAKFETVRDMILGDTVPDAGKVDLEKVFTNDYVSKIQEAMAKVGA
ncbi:MAG: ABC transporter substrate-binding protein [Nocardioides sp.]|uniref:ABC transporter substrate-binding protein n=1 Tax=Nocardioides sp. TaxID=35761 RepID=UPI0039E3EFBD